MKLSDKILHCRKKSGLSQEALAEKLNVSRQAVSKWETGEALPDLNNMVALAKCFGVTTDWLLSEEDVQSTSRPSQPQPSQGPQPRPRNSSFMKHGWILGVIMAIIGGVITLEGTIFTVAVSQFAKVTTSQTQIYDSVFPEAGIWGDIYGFGDVTDYMTDSFQAASGGITDGITAIGIGIIVFGLLLVGGGIAIAIILKRKAKKALLQ